MYVFMLDGRIKLPTKKATRDRRETKRFIIYWVLLCVAFKIGLPSDTATTTTATERTKEKRQTASNATK